jgi:outer membrane protein OmpA-like peptidoglycan-associated protein
MRKAIGSTVLAAAVLVAGAARGGETEIPGVTATLEELAQDGAMVRLGVRLKNEKPGEAHVSGAIRFSQVTLTDLGSKKKFFPAKDAAGHFLSGPTSDWNEGGRWYPKVPGASEAWIWAYFDGVPAGARVSVEIPHMFPFEDVVVAPPAPGSGQTRSSVGALTMRLVDARRTAEAVTLHLKVENPDRKESHIPAVRYADAALFDPIAKRQYALLKDTDGSWAAQPTSDKNEGGRWWVKVRAGEPALVTLRFTSPPVSVSSVDLLLPQFAPLSGIALGAGGGSESAGSAVAGRSAGLDGALRDLAAQVTPTQVKVDLSADVLFDFDRADLKPEAAASLQKVAQVISAYPGTPVSIEGHADGKGNADYNRKLSERRASAVAAWVSGPGGITASRLHTRGFGAERPIAPNKNSDGSDNPEGRAKNRRVEITIRKS